MGDTCVTYDYLDIFLSCHLNDSTERTFDIITKMALIRRLQVQGWIVYRKILVQIPSRSPFTELLGYSVRVLKKLQEGLQEYRSL